MLVLLARRLSLAGVALVVVAVIDYAPFDFPDGLERVFFHLDLGVDNVRPHVLAPAVARANEMLLAP